ncbi:hypothetical protein B5M09_007038, partial [Aphanomyces astaci]
RFKGRPKYLPGVVDSIDDGGLCTIRYDNGKVEEHIHPILLRRPQDQPEAEDNTEQSKIPRREIKPVLLMLGLDGAGKSTFLSTLQGGMCLLPDIPPTAGFSSVTFQLANGSATFYDLGGGPTIRALWKEYFADVRHSITVSSMSCRLLIFNHKTNDAGARCDLHGGRVGRRSDTRSIQALGSGHGTSHASWQALAHVLGIHTHDPHQFHWCLCLSHLLTSFYVCCSYANKMDCDQALSEAEFGQKLQVASYVNTKVLQSVTKAK